MKLHDEILYLVLQGCLGGALGGIGLFTLIFANSLSSMMTPDEITAFPYLGFGMIIAAVILVAYDLSRIRKIVDGVKSG